MSSWLQKPFWPEVKVLFEIGGNGFLEEAKKVGIIHAATSQEPPGAPGNGGGGSLKEEHPKGSQKKLQHAQVPKGTVADCFF